MTAPAQPDSSPLAASLGRYQEIFALLGELAAVIGTVPAAELSERVVRLNRLQAEAAEFDRGIDTTILTAEGELRERRATLLGEILARNLALQEKAAGHQLLLAHEMAGLRQGFTALQGYKSAGDRRGRLINSST